MKVLNLKRLRAHWKGMSCNEQAHIYALACDMREYPKAFIGIDGQSKAHVEDVLKMEVACG